MNSDWWGNHLFGGSSTRKRRYLMRGAAIGADELKEILKFHLKGHEGETIYYEIWIDGGPPRNRDNREVRQPTIIKEKQ